MARKFKMVDHEKALDQTVTIRDVLPPDHLARFIVRVILLLDLSAIYAQYAPVGGEAYAPELLLGLLFYGYATGVFSSRKIEKATYESIPFRFLAGGWHPDHDTIAIYDGVAAIAVDVSTSCRAGLCCGVACIGGDEPDRIQDSCRSCSSSLSERQFLRRPD